MEIKNTFVIGEISVISDVILEKLPNPVRLEGSDRYATSVETAKHFNLTPTKIYIATGLQFADAMTGASLNS